MKKLILIALFAATSAFAEVDMTENMDKMDKATSAAPMAQADHGGGHGLNDPHAGLPKTYVGTIVNKNELGFLLGYHHGPYFASEVELSRDKEGATKLGLLGHVHPIPKLLPLFSVSAGPIMERGRFGYAYGVGQDFKITKNAFIGIEYRRDHLGGKMHESVGIKTHIHFD